MKNHIYNLLRSDHPSKASRVFDYVIMCLILLSLIEIVLESFPYFKGRRHIVLEVVEWVTIVVFSVEYIMRLYTADLKYPDSKWPIVRFIFSVSGIIDLLAILPFYLPFMGLDLRFIRSLRLLRLLVIFKFNRYNKSLLLIKEVLREKRSDLGVSAFVLFVVLVIISVLMYSLEHEAQPDSFPNILASFWWSVITLTTVGYGDIYPVTGVGKLVTSFISILSIGIVAIPTGILASGFTAKLDEQKEPKKCPHCGKELISD